jgi:hypothetical protein
MRTRIERVRLALRATLAAATIAVAVAACGGGHVTHNAAPKTAHPTSGGASSTAGIPQGNGGDQDADNNGGPSDGDGAI